MIDKFVLKKGQFWEYKRMKCEFIKSSFILACITIDRKLEKSKFLG